jgi:hypothetical protein
MGSAEECFSRPEGDLNKESHSCPSHVASDKEAPLGTCQSEMGTAKESGEGVISARGLWNTFPVRNIPVTETAVLVRESG